IEFFITILLRTCRTLTGFSLVPLRIKLMHHRSSLPSEFRRLLGPNVEFSCNADEVIYPGSLAQTPCTNADPYLNALLERYCEQALCGSPQDVKHVAAESRKRTRALIAAWPGQYRHNRQRTWREPANAGASSRLGRSDVSKGLGPAPV